MLLHNPQILRWRVAHNGDVRHLAPGEQHPPSEVKQICGHEPRADRLKFRLRSDVLPSTASNGQSGSVNCSLKANQSAKSVRSPISRISRKFIGGWTRTTTFATNTRARARSRPIRWPQK